MLLETTSCSSASRSVRNSRVDTGSFAALRWRKKSMSMEKSSLTLLFQQMHQVPLHRRPLALDDAEHDRVAVAAVGRDLVIAEHPVLLGAESRNRFARGMIEPMRAELDRDAFERLEGVGEQQELALGVDRGALCTLRIPRIADFQAAIRRIDVEVACAADD